MTKLNVLAAPVLDPGAQRIEMEVPFGLTIREIVQATLPTLASEHYGRVRVVLATAMGCEVIAAEHWHCVRPRPHVRVVIRLVPGSSGLRQVLQIVVAVAAVALGQLWAPLIAGSAFGMGLSTATWQGLIGLGVGMIGNLLINALIPVQSDKDKEKPTYAISGWRNNANPDGPVPAVLGKHRWAPPFAAQTYTEIVDDIQYIRSLFCFGYGPVSISDLKIGDTTIDKYKDIEIELREGLPTDQPVQLYTEQVIEEQLGVELRRDRPRNAYGDIIEGPAELTPVARFSASDATGACVILSFPAGLVSINSKGEPKPITNTIRIRQRRVGTSSWTTVQTIAIRASKREGFYRFHRWSFPSRGRYEIECTRMNNERDDPSKTDRTVWIALQSFRPEYPLAFGAAPLALAALRVRATYQLNGALDNFNCIVQRRCLDYDNASKSWVERETRNPASLFRWVLQGPANAVPVRDDEIDLDLLADWHNFCRTKGLKYDRIHDFEASLFETLSTIAAAGRASPRHDGRKWGVVIDRPQTLVIDHVNPRNSSDFAWSRTYIEPPHAFRVPFLDQTNDYQSGERIVPWPGHTGDITLTEQLDLPGKTDPGEIWREARRRQYEIIHRPDTYSVVQDGPARVATRGDLVMVSHDVLTRVQIAARVTSVRGNLIVLDEEITMQEGQTYAIRFQRVTAQNTVGTSVVRRLHSTPDVSQSVILTGDGYAPKPGDIVHFGPVEQESYPMIVSYTEAGQNMSTVLHLLDAAPVIDELTDAEVPPTWDGRVGAEVISGTQVPGVPVIRAVLSGWSGTEIENGLQVLVAVGVGSTAIIDYFNLRHRLSGAGSWTTISEPGAAGAFDIEGYAAGDTVEFAVQAVSIKGYAGAWTATMSVTIGEGDPALPVSLPSASISVVGGIGHALIVFAAGDDAALAFVQLYRAPAGVALDRAAHQLGGLIAVEQLASYSRTDGDVTRTNMVRNPAFSSADAWTLGEGWTVTGGKATHQAGVASDIEQTGFQLTAGKSYRIRFDISARTAGTISIKLTGSTGEVSSSAFAANGGVVTELTPNAVFDTLMFAASEDFDGSITNVVLYEITPSTLPYGSYDYYLEPLNIDRRPGPISGPFTVTVQ